MYYVPYGITCGSIHSPFISLKHKGDHNCAPNTQIKHKSTPTPRKIPHGKNVVTIKTLTHALRKLAPIVFPDRDKWVVIDQYRNKLTLKLGTTNSVICPGTGKSQKYRHLMKFPNNQKWINSMFNKISCFFQSIGDIKDTNTCF